MSNVSRNGGNTRVLAIIGIGPRGLSAFESLILSLQKSKSLRRIQILLFEQTALEGCGPVYNINQVDTNWINITERILLLEGRPILSLGTKQVSAFPSYHEWIKKDFSEISPELPDTYPPRSQIGRYLRKRWLSIFEPLLDAGIAKIYNEKILDIVPEDSKFDVVSDRQIHKAIDEILLTIGHQPTEPSSQVKKWGEFSEENPSYAFYKHPYPIQQFFESDNLNSNARIGIRGFGLAMIDVVRGIAQKFGSFRIDDTRDALYFDTDKELSSLFVPFSLDGLPIVPKPINAVLDKKFKPNQKDLKTFADLIGELSIQKNAEDVQFLIDPISQLTANIYSASNLSTENCHLEEMELRGIVKEWLLDSDFEHSLIISKRKGALQQMKDYVAMANGSRPISLDFCIGQVWRHCQPTIYDRLSFNECEEAVFADVIALDERMKRYAYGPPVASVKQLIALTESGIMNLDFVNDPDITVGDAGWQLANGKTSITLSMMVNSVLDAPQLKTVQSDLVQNIISKGLIKPVHDDLGIETNDENFVLSDHGEALNIAVLGRLAKGTIIGVDAILECFGKRSKIWADKAASNHKEWLVNQKA